MTLSLNSVLLSNNNLVVIETSGPRIRAIMKTPTGEILYTGDYTFTATREVIIQEAILSLYPFGNITIIESNLETPPPPPPTSPPPTPQQIEQTRQEELAATKEQSAQADQKTVDVNLIQNATPNNLKAQGLAKLPFIIYTLGNQVKTIIQPSLEKLIKQYVEKYISQGVCLIPAELILLRQQRDLIVNQLNNIGNKIDKIGNTITGISTFLNVLLGLINTLDLTAMATSLALKAPGVNTLPVPGSIVSLISDAQNVISKVKFDNLGNPKLSKYQAALGGSALVLSVISSYILKAVESLKLIDNVLKECDPDNPLIPINSQIDFLASSQLQASQTQNQITYQGFIIEIQEVPFDSTVVRRKAVGKNSQGIPLIETQLSFTTNNQTLINELKLIIDRDNLKAY